MINTHLKRALARLSISQIIIHEVPKHLRSANTESIRYSEVCSELELNTRSFLKDRMVESLNSQKSFRVCFDDNRNSTAPALIKEFLASDGTGFVPFSKKLADCLFAAQDGTSPGGWLAVMEGTSQGHRAIGILKLEKGEGVRLEQVFVDNKPTYELLHLKDLVLNKNTKVYKVAFVVGNPDYSAVASDNQAAPTSRSGLASFFLEDFLGCRLVDDPEVVTKEFYNCFGDFVDQAINDPIERLKMRGHLVSELGSNTGQVSIERFATTYLPEEFQQGFIEYMTAKSMPATFRKDTALIAKDLERNLYDFASGITVIAPIAAEKDRITITKTAEGLSDMRIVDRLKEVRGRR